MKWLRRQLWSLVQRINPRARDAIRQEQALRLIEARQARLLARMEALGIDVDIIRQGGA